MEKTTTIQVRETTRQRLSNLATKGETYDNVITRLLNKPKLTGIFKELKE